MKKMTPMKQLKKEIDQLKSVSFLNFLSLNGRPRQRIALGSEDWRTIISSNAISFDYIGIFGISGDMFKTDKGHLRYAQSLGICINYKKEETIRASVVMSKDSGMEYSKEYTVSEFKTILKDFVSKIDVIKNKETFLKAYIDAFGIILSETLSKSEINNIKDEKIKSIKELNEQIRRSYLAQGDARNSIRNSETEIEKMAHVNRLKGLCSLVEVNYSKISKIIKLDTKDMPSLARDYFVSELKKLRIMY